MGKEEGRNRRRGRGDRLGKENGKKRKEEYSIRYYNIIVYV